ncbi:MAG: hypothetical protein MRZ61_07100 [Oscillospiraceae bacterium]|nr:hypothetical protein [Oscillospiraceae bacterium]
MPKKLKAALITAAFLVIIAAGYICTESIRLRNSPCGTKPLITTGCETTDRMEIYNGLGYSVGYHTYDGRYYGAEFRLFGKLLVWAWIE